MLKELSLVSRAIIRVLGALRTVTLHHLTSNLT